MTRTLSALVVGASTLWMLAACGSSGDGSTGPTPDFTVSASTAAAATLATVANFNVTVASTGAAGTVGLVVTGAPASWVVGLPSTAPVLASNGSVAVPVTVTIPSNGDAAASGRTLTIAATVGSTQHTATSVVTVANEFLVPIALGTGAGSHWPSVSGKTFILNVGTTVTFRNDDTTSHEIHSDGNAGIAHESPPGLSNGESFSQTVTASGTAHLSCHTHDHADQFIVQVN